MSLRTPLRPYLFVVLLLGTLLPSLDATAQDQAVDVLDSLTDGFTSTAVDADGNLVVFLSPREGPFVGDLVLIRCDGLSCDYDDAVTVASEEETSEPATPRVTLAQDGMPVLAYGNQGPRSTQLVFCEDPTCTSSTNTQVDERVALQGLAVAAAATGHATVVGGFTFFDEEANSLDEVPGIAGCTGPDCADLTNRTLPNEADETIRPVDVEYRADGTPVALFSRTINEFLNMQPTGIVHDCSDAACSTSTDTLLDFSPLGLRDEADDLDMALDGDLPVIGFQALGTSLEIPGIARCRDRGCTQVDMRTLVEEEFEVVEGTRVVVQDGVLYVAYRAADEYFVAACDDPLCEGDDFASYPAPPDIESAALRLHVMDGVPVLMWVGGTPAEDTLSAIVCTDPACVPGTGGGSPPAEGRLGTDDPNATAITISQQRFDDAGAFAGGRAANAVVLSRDDAFADSLAGAVLTKEAPLLFTATGQLDPAVRAEVDRVLGGAGTVYLLGGVNALAPAVADELTAAGYTVRRLAGPSRVETAVAIADEAVAALGTPPEAFVVRADSPPDNPTAAWADSVSVGAWSAVSEQPVLLTPTTLAHPAVQAWLQSQPGTTPRVVGGEAAVSSAVEAELGASNRVSGPNRFASAVAVAEQLWGPAAGPGYVISSSGPSGWLYGLAGAGLAADTRQPLLLVTPEQEPPETEAAICVSGAPRPFTVLAGPAEIPDAVVAALSACP